MSNRKAEDTFPRCTNCDARGVCMYVGPCLECAFARARAATRATNVRLFKQVCAAFKATLTAATHDEFTLTCSPEHIRMLYELGQALGVLAPVDRRRST